MKRALNAAAAIGLALLMLVAFDAWIFGDEFPIHAPELIEVDLPAAQLRVMT